MSTKYINWVRTYHITHSKGPVRFYLSSHLDGSFHGMVIYAERKGNWEEESGMELDFKDQRFYANNEQDVYDLAIKFIDSTLGKPYNISLPPITSEL